MEPYIKVIILPRWNTPAQDQKEAIFRGNLTLQYLRQSEKLERAIKQVITGGGDIET
jgi:hypothetical protein